MKKVSGKKSGFQEGRSKVGPSRSSAKSQKKSDKPESGSKAASKAKRKLDRARDDLADTLRDMDIGEFVFDGETVDETGESASRFASDFGLIRKSILRDGEEFNAEAAHKMILKTQLAMFLELQPIAEIAFRNSKKEQAAYAAIAVAEQVKGISSELKMIGNIENQSAFIKDRVIQPIFMVLVEHMMRQFLGLKNTIDTELSGTKNQEAARTIKRAVDASLSVLTSFLDASREGMGANIHSYLSGDLTFMSSSGDGSKNAIGKRKRGNKNRDR